MGEIFSALTDAIAALQNKKCATEATHEKYCSGKHHTNRYLFITSMQK